MGMPDAVIAPTDPSRTWTWVLVKGGGWLHARGNWQLAPVTAQIGLPDEYVWIDTLDASTLLRMDTIGGWCSDELPPEGRTMSPSRTSTPTAGPAESRGRAIAGSGTVVLGGTVTVTVVLDTPLPSAVYDCFPTVLGPGLQADAVTRQTATEVDVRCVAYALTDLAKAVVKVWCAA